MSFIEGFRVIFLIFFFFTLRRVGLLNLLWKFHGFRGLIHRMMISMEISGVVSCCGLFRRLKKKNT